MDYYRDAVAVLRQARELIANPANWCQGETARDAEGWSAHPEDGRARRWDAIGAVERVAGRGSKVCGDALNLLYDVVPGGVSTERGVASVNDDDGHAAVLDLFDSAIAQFAVIEHK